MEVGGGQKYGGKEDKVRKGDRGGLASEGEDGLR